MLNKSGNKRGLKTKELWKDFKYRKYMTELHIGKEGYWSGKKRDKETLEKMKQSMLGKIGYWANKKRPEISGEHHYLWNPNKGHRIGWSKEVRGPILERDSHRCVVCGKKYDDKECSIHHIDKNKNNHKNSNLITLCINHHMKAERNSQPVGIIIFKAVLVRKI